MSRLRMMAGGWLAGLVVPLSATAADVQLSGLHYTQRDVTWIAFSVQGAASHVVMSTDSHMGGVNFDPLLTLWTAGGLKITQADDIDPAHGGFDALLDAGMLSPGQYLVTVTASPNSALGDTSAAGFLYDHAAPVSLGTWCQPAAFDCSAGGLWRLSLSGVNWAATAATTAAAPVPEPASALLLLGGLAAVAGAARRRSAQVHAAA